ncbi:MAG TPA: hypothetical protein PKW07_02670 [Syntrophorhabdaceae bacterium]|nr:hypothetical protein [Syntrophorhabdaceae bacterium]
MTVIDLCRVYTEIDRLFEIDANIQTHKLYCHVIKRQGHLQKILSRTERIGVITYDSPVLIFT